MPYSVEERECQGMPWAELIFWEEDWKYGIDPNSEEEIIEHNKEVYYEPVGETEF